jgi:hypothetical protein
VYELRGHRLRFLIVPFTGSFSPVTILLLVLLLASAWFWLVFLVYLAFVSWRASRLRLAADPSGITVVNVVRRRKVAWPEISGIWADEGWPGPSVRIERHRGRLRSVGVNATYGYGREGRRSIALRLAELGRTYGYGFVTGDAADLEELRKAGLWNETDPAVLQAWWDARVSPRDDESADMPA